MSTSNPPVSAAQRRATDKYKLNNPDKVKAWNKTYYEKNSEEIKRKRRARYNMNKYN